MLHIMYGLPASGKTTLAMKLFEGYCKKYEKTSWSNRAMVTYLNLDENDRKCISNRTHYGTQTYENVFTIVDGFFKNIKDINNFWNCYIRHCDTTKIKIHVFKQDKQACFENDKLRGRKELATHSINEGQEEFDLEVFKNTFFKDRMYLLREAKITVENINVISYDQKEDYTIYSPWLVGDDIGDDFTELDDWLEEHYPKLTFLQYKRICKHIKNDEEFTSDYYDKHDTRSLRRSIKISDILKELENV